MKNWTFQLMLTLAITLNAAFAPPANAQEAKTSIFQQLTAKEGAKITLELDFTTLLSNRKQNQYHPAVLTDENGKQWEVEVKPRGKYRRKISEFPPLKINFKKKALKSAGLDTLNEIKLSLPVKDSREYDQLVVREYLAYKMFEKLSDASVKAQLVKVTIIDSHVNEKHSCYGILIEDEEETSARLKCTPVESYGIPLDSLQINQVALVSAFEYMIGNTDWDISMIRNVRMVRSYEGGKIVVIPYDFDFSGFVSAPYASPSSESGLRNVRERFLMAYGLPQSAIRRATNRIVESKQILFDLLNNKYLDKTNKDDTYSYLESFFNKVETAKDVPATMPAPEAE